jgi:AAHS family 4-hydroxybenzoate transporter-like MFS transporter
MAKKDIEITALIDSAKYIGLPLAITVLTIMIMLVDGFDLQTMAFVAPELVKEWGVSRAALTPAITASMVGMAVGSVLLGWAGDRIGRKNSYIICIAFLGIGSFFSAHSDSLTQLVIWRVVTGIGLGGVTPLAATMISEWTPKHARNVAVACAIVAVPLGGMLGAQVSQWVIPAYGWRGVFWIGAILPFFFFIVAIFLLPESPKYLTRHKHLHGKLAKLLNRLFREKRFDGTENFVVDEPPAPPGNWFATLMSPAYRKTTLLLWAAFAFNTLALYSFVNLLPTILASTGMDTVESLQGSKFLNGGGFFGAVGGAILIGVWGSRYVGSAMSAMGAVATLLIGLTIFSNTGSLNGQSLLLFTLAGVAVNGMQCFLYTVGAHSYPTYIRASGVGTAQTVSRIGGFLGTVAGGSFFALDPQPPVSYIFYAIAGAFVLVVVSFYSLRTHIPGHKQSLALQAQAVQKGGV